jgi:hypothetical protein
VQKRLTMVIVGAALAATLTFVAAGSSGREPQVEPQAEPGPAPNARVLTIVRAYAPNDQRGPRIIHVPQADERASVNERDEPAVSNDNDDDEVAPPPRRRINPKRHSNVAQHPRTPRWQFRNELPPPAEGPTPVRPTPRFGAKAGAADKFGEPRDARSSAPPPGNTPPTALPPDDESVDAADK